MQEKNAEGEFPRSEPGALATGHAPPVANAPGCDRSFWSKMRLPWPRRLADVAGDVVVLERLPQEYLLGGGHQAHNQQEKLVQRHQEKDQADKRVSARGIAVKEVGHDLDQLETEIEKVESQSDLPPVVGQVEAEPDDPGADAIHAEYVENP